MQHVQQFNEVGQDLMRHFLVGYIDHSCFFQDGPEFISVFGEDYGANNNLE